MVGRRKQHVGLSLSRIYIKGKRFYYFAPEPILNQKTGKLAKWHALCDVSEGEDKARELVRQLVQQSSITGAGDFTVWMDKYCTLVLARREKLRPADPMRSAMFSDGQKEIKRSCDFIAAAFMDFDVAQVLPVDVAQFVDQWEGRRAASYYLSRLSGFLSWCCRRGLRADNPCREVSVEKTKPRSRYITDQEFYAIRDALMIDERGVAVPSGAMLQCYVDLCYLLYQRTTEIRLLKWSDVDDEVIYFKPTKTERSSGGRVAIPISSAVRAVLERARAIGRVKSIYVIHSRGGKPYMAHGLGTAWDRACKRVGIEDARLKDLRAKALTDAKQQGYKLDQLQIAAVHTDPGMTDRYIKRREVPLSEVVLRMPERLS